MKKNLFLAIGMIALMSSCGDSNKNNQPVDEVDTISEANEAELKAKQEEEALINSLFSWTYTNTEDEMTSKTTKSARITSKDIVNLDFPYEGGTTSTLFLRDKDGSLDAFFGVSDGQLSTDYSNPMITVRFDDNAPEVYRVSKAADGDSKILFFNNAKQFIEKTKASDSLKIQCMFYHNGKHVYTFHTKGLEW